MAELWDRGQTKGACIVPPVILSRAFVAPNANYMSTVHAPYHERLAVGDGTIEGGFTNGSVIRKEGTILRIFDIFFF